MWNDVVIAAMMRGVPLAAALAHRQMLKRMASYEVDQAALRLAYDITADTPVAGYDEATRARVQAYVRAHPGARIATTSGSTGAPKELAYDAARIAQFKADSARCAVIAYARLGIKKPGMFVLGSLKSDDSFASLVLNTRPTVTPRLAGLVEPARYLLDPRVAPLVAAHGLTAVRLWLLTVCDPGMLYATNPSTLASFFTEVTEGWAGCKALLRRLAAGDLAHDLGLQALMRRVGSGDAVGRLARAADAGTVPAVDALAPSLGGYCAWDGGYTTAFLPAVHAFLPPSRYRHLPMYAMSTETIETLPVFDDDGTLRFLPLGPRVLYEFLPVEADDRPDLLLAPAAVEAGRDYALVVSDPWGLRRYQTDDVFHCVASVNGLPDLRFVRRRGLAYSFTGEKLTGIQLEQAYATLRAAFAALGPGVELTCFPAHPHGAAVPHYHLVLAPAVSATVAVDVDAVARALDAALQDQNAELRDKRTSGRLGPFTASVVPYKTLAGALDRRTQTDDDQRLRAWESQFKLTPLSLRRFETLALGDARNPH